MIDAIYILKENGTMLFSKTSPRMAGSPETFDDLVSGFFSAIQMFSTNQLKEGGISHVQFQSNRRLYYKDFKMDGDNTVRFVILTSPLKNGKDTYGTWIDNKTIKIKWLVQEFRDYLGSDEIPPPKIQSAVKEKIDNLVKGL